MAWPGRLLAFARRNIAMACNRARNLGKSDECPLSISGRNKIILAQGLGDLPGATRTFGDKKGVTRSKGF